jgi:uridylate kinase
VTPKDAPASAGRGYRRALVKLSGEGIAGKDGRLDPDVVEALATDLRELLALGKEIAIVVGGGNYLRGAKLEGINRAVADQMGMLATAMNGLALQDVLEQKGIPTRVQSAVNIADFCEPFIRRRCIRHLEKKRVVILVAGTGNPFFSTDTAAALRASEIGADGLLKATQVDGVYTADPKKDKKAIRMPHLSYREVIEKNLKAMDTSAVVLCEENDIPIHVFDLHQRGNLMAVMRGEPIGTLIDARGSAKPGARSRVES